MITFVPSSVIKKTVRVRSFARSPTCMPSVTPPPPPPPLDPMVRSGSKPASAPAANPLIAITAAPPFLCLPQGAAATFFIFRTTGTTASPSKPFPPAPGGGRYSTRCRLAWLGSRAAESESLSLLMLPDTSPEVPGRMFGWGGR